MNREEGNKVVQQTIARLVVEEITDQSFGKADVMVGPLMINYFSFIFLIHVMNGQKPYKVFVKIPKEDLRRGPGSILPITPAERIMAEDEARSLRTLAGQWHSDDLGVSWVRLRAFLPQYNAIVTEAAAGEDAIAVFRRMDLRRRLGFAKDRLRLRGAMARLGEALGRFHKRSAQSTVFRMDETLPKLEHYCRELGANVRCPMPGLVSKILNSMAGLETMAMETPTLKGIDIRNVLMDERDRIFLLDPGRLKRTCREADLARFIMTCRILYWGSGLFLLGLRPDSQAEKAFLETYYSNTAPPDPKLLSLYLIKEQLKHWHTAIDSLHLLPWSMSVKRLIAATYVNPYYTRQLTLELKKVI